MAAETEHDAVYGVGSGSQQRVSGCRRDTWMCLIGSLDEVAGLAANVADTLGLWSLISIRNCCEHGGLLGVVLGCMHGRKWTVSDRPCACQIVVLEEPLSVAWETLRALRPLSVGACYHSVDNSG